MREPQTNVMMNYVNTRYATDLNTVLIIAPTMTWVIDDKGEPIPLVRVARDAAGRYVKPAGTKAILQTLVPYTPPSIDVPSSGLPASSSRRFVGQLVIRAPTSRPRAVVAAMNMDTGSQVLEANEFNNGYAECEVLQ